MITADKTMRDIVLEYNGTAAVLEKYGLDFCCQGTRSLVEACRQKNLNTELVLNELQATFVDEPGFNRYQKWDLAFLCDYIINYHHSFVKEMLPQVSEHLNKVVAVYSLRYPELKEVGRLFAAVKQELEMHLAKEEHVLFPYINEMVHSHKSGAPLSPAHFGTVDHPIARMLEEHEFAGESMEQIRELLEDYTPPGDACTTMKLTYNELQAFERDLHQHVFLENAILFPRAQQLEQELKS